jgi:hypothetical protein
MSLRRILALAVLFLFAARAAHAVCTAKAIRTAESCAPVAVSCSITGHYTIDDGCTIDFGSQNITLSGQFTIGSNTATIKAGGFTVSGTINGIGSASGTRGGLLMIETTGNFAVPQTGTIDVSGDLNGGSIIVNAGAAATIAGDLFADDLNKQAGGGLIDITAVGNISTTAAAKLSAQGGNDSDGGGEIDLIAGGTLMLLSQPNVNGLCGGFLDFEAGGSVNMLGAQASGGGDAGSGGCVDVVAGQGTTVSGQIVADGATGSFMTGGCGGLICLDGGLGDVTIPSTAVVEADGAPPDGGGGLIEVITRGNSIVSGQISAHGPGGSTCGGCVCILSGLNTNINAGGGIDISGGCSGGGGELDAGLNLTINGTIDVSGQMAGSLGGDLVLHAGVGDINRFGDFASGNLTVNTTLDVSSNPNCSHQNGCGEGGTSDLSGCNVTISAAGGVLASGPEAGENDVTAREQLTVKGTLDATTSMPSSTPGINRLIYPARRKPTVQANLVNPTPVLLALTTCPTEGETTPPCLMPCPVCGNGVVEFPETCDQGKIPPQSCSGCSIYCQNENCNDGLTCTGDSCDPRVGCRHVPTPLCTEPTATATATRPTATTTLTRTVTRTGSATPTATTTPTPSATPPATNTAPPTGTATPTATASLTPTASRTAGATATPTATGAAAASATPTVTRTPTATVDTPTPTTAATSTATSTSTATAISTATVTPEATVTPPPACPGDCDGSNSVTVNELIRGVNIALGNADISTCPAFDRNGDGMVSINELIAAVNAALDGC